MKKEFTFKFLDNCDNVVYVITTVGECFGDCCERAMNLADQNCSWDSWEEA